MNHDQKPVKFSLPWSTTITLLGALLAGIFGYATLHATVAANQLKNIEQDLKLEKMVDQAAIAAVQRGRIEQDVKHIQRDVGRILEMMKERRVDYP